ncbi:hypothetical protein JTB14_002647 [Gonioctena quinquepunctata]|nr:hypothetical protein JTB14_002647 [Gonioctena quinquepunctata]
MGTYIPLMSRQNTDSCGMFTFSECCPDLKRNSVTIRRDTINSRLPRSASIDSMVEAVWAESSESPEQLIPEKRPSLRPDRPLALVSPSVGRRMKGQRGINVYFAEIDQKGPGVCRIDMFFGKKYPIGVCNPLHVNVM